MHERGAGALLAALAFGCTESTSEPDAGGFDAGISDARPLDSEPRDSGAGTPCTSPPRSCIGADNTYHGLIEVPNDFGALASTPATWLSATPIDHRSRIVIGVDGTRYGIMIPLVGAELPTVAAGAAITLQTTEDGRVHIEDAVSGAPIIDFISWQTDWSIGSRTLGPLVVQAGEAQCVQIAGTACPDDLNPWGYVTATHVEGADVSPLSVAAHGRERIRIDGQLFDLYNFYIFGLEATDAPPEFIPARSCTFCAYYPLSFFHVALVAR